MTEDEVTKLKNRIVELEQDLEDERLDRKTVDEYSKEQEAKVKKLVSDLEELFMSSLLLLQKFRKEF